VVIAPEQLRRWTRVRIGANLIALDLASVKRNLELVSTIDSVSVERVLAAHIEGVRDRTNPGGASERADGGRCGRNFYFRFFKWTRTVTSCSRSTRAYV